MSFESEVRHADDEFTSPDLALLAEQLQQDAAMLAGKYPARPLPQRQQQHRGTRRRRLRLSVVLGTGAAAAALVAVSIGPWSWWSQPAAFRRELAERPIELHGGLSVSPQATVESARTTTVPETMPVVLFHSLSGPEKEAVLDLFENSTSAEARLSI